MNETNLETSPDEQMPAKELDGILDEFATIKDFSHKYGTWIITGMCIGLVIIAGTKLYRNNAKKHMESASKALMEARTSRDIEAIMENYGETPTAPLALLRLAKTYYDAENFDVAMNRYELFKTEYPEHEFLPIAELGEIHCIEAKQLLNEALQRFESFAVTYPDSFLKIQAVLGKARCLKDLGRISEARAVYEDLMVANPQGRWVSMIEDILDGMDRENKTPAETKIEQDIQNNVVEMPSEQNNS